MTQEQLHQLALHYMKGIGAVTAKTLVSYCGSLSNVFSKSKSQLTKIPGIGLATAELIVNNDAIAFAERQAKFIIDHEIQFSFYLDDDYPTRLKNYPNAPVLLYYKGNKFSNLERTVAIVGTRQPSEYGKLMTQKLIAELKDYHVSIISGLAYGIDTIAHRSCIENNIPTFGVLGNGLKKIYPSQNMDLAKRMQEQGGIMTEFHFNTTPERENFPKRNRIIAGMSDAIIVIESAAKGGSIITANIANEYFKDVFAVPGRINDDRSIGCNKLIKEHKAALVESAKDIAYIMGWEKTTKKTNQLTLALDLDPKEKRIVDFLKSQSPVHIDLLHYELSLAQSELSVMLLNLEFMGIVRSLPGKKYNLA